MRRDEDPQDFWLRRAAFALTALFWFLLAAALWT